MGAKDSKRSSCLSYEDAVKRMSDIEYKRVCEAFKRLAGPSALLNKAAFIQNVLGDGVPAVIAEWLYGACGGSAKGISQRDLICGLVLLTRGIEEEKIRFLWCLYSNEAGTWIHKQELEKALRLEGADTQMIAQTLSSLFGADQQDNRVAYDQFKAYLAYNKEATVLSKWLLICLNTIGEGSSPYNSLRSSCGLNNSSVPTFYQSLAGVTHLHERDIADLEKAFWAVQAQSPTSQLDRAALMALVSPPVPASLCEGLFLALDENQDGHIDFKELCCGISAACRGPKAERMKFCLKMFDMDRDNQLNTIELEHLRRTLTFISPDQDQQHLTLGNTNPSTSIFSLDSSSLSLQDFLMWAINHEDTLEPLLQLLFQVGHVNLGLRPQCRHMERGIVLGWRKRERERGYRVGQYWYLISSDWWHNWMNYTMTANGCQECGGLRTPPPHQQQEESSYGGSSASSNQSTSTDSMGDLLLIKTNNADTVSLGSSSGVSSGSNAVATPTTLTPPPPPGPIDNSILLNSQNTTASPAGGVPTLTGEGGRLRTDITLCEGRDFILVPDSLWKAVAMWYGGTLPLPRQVILSPDSIEPELELYPLNLRILRHQQTQQVTSQQLAENKVPGRYLAHTAAFSRLATVRQVSEFLATPLQRRSDEVRLWLVKTNELIAMEEDGGELTVTLNDLGVKDGDQLLLEVRNVDLTWPEELGALAQANKTTSNSIDSRRPTIGGYLPSGATGLHNLGNTCFMNAALQAVSNTKPLTRYFLRNTHLHELNTLNPMGSRGQVARRYAELVRELWSATPNIRSVAPLKLRWCVTKHAPDTLGGGGQHDSQELLAWLLDQLHEDLNRVPTHKKIYRELKDSDGRPDEEVAAEAWRLHSARDVSIITDLFYGQLKSKVTCEACKHESVRFDAFNLLSLPLPMENYTLCEVLVLRQSFSDEESAQVQVPFKYGVRLRLKRGLAKVRHLKRHLQRLCGVPAYRLLVTVLAHAQIHQSLQDDEQLPAAVNNSINRAFNNVVELVAFELPTGAHLDKQIYSGAVVDDDDESEAESDVDEEEEDKKDKVDEKGKANAVVVQNGATSTNGSIKQQQQQQQQQLVLSPEVRASSSALCMPNILCFKTTVAPVGGAAHHSNAHSMAGRRLSSPPPIITPSTTFVTDQQPMNTIYSDQSSAPLNEGSAPTSKLPSYLIAVHRKSLRQETYFLHQQRSKPSLFGIPMLLACSYLSTTGQDLYEDAWRQVGRLLSPAPPENSAAHKLLNHATDCDDSLRYEFPFILRTVLPGGQICALCHWTNFCRGCAIPCCNDTRLVDLGSGSTIADLQIAIDWDPTALHLRYQSGRERAYIQHDSLFDARRLHTEPIDLDHCLRAFTQEERLEAKYHCGGCKSKQAATKKLQIWRLPPILIVHLKRFDRATCLDGDVSKWVKTHKVVNFPFDGFDLTAYLAAVPQQTILRHRQLLLQADHADHAEGGLEELTQVNCTAASSDKSARERLESTSLQRTPIQDEHLHDYHQHHLQPGQDAFDLAYQLYAVVSHSGMMTGGHYVSYAHNPNGHWYCYNDSSCREVALDQLATNIDPSAAYILFYERKGLDYRPYLADLQRHPQSNNDVDHQLADTTEQMTVINDGNSSRTASIVLENGDAISGVNQDLSVAQEATEDVANVAAAAAAAAVVTTSGGGDSSDSSLRQFCRLQ